MTQETNLLDIDAGCLIEEADVQTTPVVEVINVESKAEPKKRGRKKRVLQSTGEEENNDSTTSAVNEKKEEDADEEQIYIPSGVTLVDLASSDTTLGFCTAGHTVNIIGDRNSGKSMMCMASMAETYHRHGDIFEYDYYDYERAISFDVPRLFGKKFNEKLNLCEPDNSAEWCIENIRTKILNDLLKHRRYIIIDSCDIMKPLSEIERIYKVADGKGTFGTERAKAMTAFFRSICPAVAESGSFMIIVSQARDNIGYGSMFTPKVRSGGSALGYNAFVEMWLAPAGQIKSGEFKVGQWTKAKIERSKVNGKKHSVEFAILPAYGIDDTRSNINWLIENGALQCSSGKIDMSALGEEFAYNGKNPYLFVEENGLESKLVEYVRKVWDCNEQALISKTFGGRKGRYE